MALRQTRKPWNKGKIVGPKPALTPDQVKAIRTVLELKAPIRDQLLFSIAIGSSLRGRDLVRLRVSDVAVDGEPRSLIRIRPSKTEARSRLTIAFEPTETTRALLSRHLQDLYAVEDLPLFTRQKGGDGTPRPISERAYLTLVKSWVSAIGRRLKTLSGLTPYEYICKLWTSEPDRFILDPIHQMPGLNS